MLSNKEKEQVKSILKNFKQQESSKLVTFAKEILESNNSLTDDKIISNLISKSTYQLPNNRDINNKIEICQQNLIIFKKALDNTRLRREETFDRAQKGIINEYCYRDILIRQMEEYRKAKKVANDATNTENYDNLTNLAIKEKYKLMNMYETYNKVRDDESLQIANDAILAESEAMQFMNAEMSKLLDALIEKSGDQGESVIYEISELLED
jgi:hypothetical protein